MDMKHVKGKSKGDIVVYALSTCVWCKKTRVLLEELEAEYSYIYVDLIKSDDEISEIMEDMKRCNPRFSFPTTIIHKNGVVECIIGYDEERIRKVLG